LQVNAVKKTITIYGTWWCGQCTRVRRFFDRNSLIYQWVDIDKDKKGEEFVLSTNHGMRSVPTIVFEDGSFLVEPNDTQLTHKLQSVLK
jgi:mycoredoxin